MWHTSSTGGLSASFLFGVLLLGMVMSRVCTASYNYTHNRLVVMVTGGEGLVVYKVLAQHNDVDIVNVWVDLSYL